MKQIMFELAIGVVVVCGYVNVYVNVAVYASDNEDVTVFGYEKIFIY